MLHVSLAYTDCAPALLGFSKHKRNYLFIYSAAYFGQWIKGKRDIQNMLLLCFVTLIVPSEMCSNATQCSVKKKEEIFTTCRGKCLIGTASKQRKLLHTICCRNKQTCFCQRLSLGISRFLFLVFPPSSLLRKWFQIAVSLTKNHLQFFLSTAYRMLFLSDYIFI